MEILYPSLHKLIFFIYLIIALSALVAFVLQIIKVFWKLHIPHIFSRYDKFLEFKDRPYKLLTGINLTSFFLGLGWSGIFFFKTIKDDTSLFLLTLVIGVITLGLSFSVSIYFWLLLKGGDELDCLDEINKNIGEVLISIPPNNSGSGRVYINIKNQVHELDAVTFHQQPIRSGRVVTVVGINNNTLIVDPL